VLISDRTVSQVMKLPDPLTSSAASHKYSFAASYQ
jgi:hypothetical protein